MEFKEALKEILKIKGSLALKEETTLKLLDDYGAFDEHPVFRSIMGNIIAMKNGEMLQNTFYYSNEDKGQAWEQMKNQVSEGLPYDKVFMDTFFKDIEYAFMGYAYERGTSDRDIKSEVEQMLGQVWIDECGVKYSSDKKKLINGSEVEGNYLVNPETEFIDSYAFQQNSKIKHITFPPKLKTIRSHVFQNCTYLSRVNFQGEINEIGKYAFGGCSSLKEVYLPGGLKKISEGLFSVCTDLLYVHIPDTVTGIAANAFGDCHNLQYVVIPDKVTSIGDYAFQCCNSLYYVILPSKLTSVGENVFDNCKALRYIGIPKGTISRFTIIMPKYAHLFVEYATVPTVKKHNLDTKPQNNKKTIEIIDVQQLAEYAGMKDVTKYVDSDCNICYVANIKLFQDELKEKHASYYRYNRTTFLFELLNSDKKVISQYCAGYGFEANKLNIENNVDKLFFYDLYFEPTDKWYRHFHDTMPQYPSTKIGWGLRTVYDKGKYYVVDKNNKIVIPPGKYDYIDGFHKLGYTRVMLRNNDQESSDDTGYRCGIIDVFDNIILPVKYTHIQCFFDRSLKGDITVWEGGMDIEGKYTDTLYEYKFGLLTKELKLTGDCYGGYYNDYKIEDNNTDLTDQYTIWDALDGESEAAGNIDWEG